MYRRPHLQSMRGKSTASRKLPSRGIFQKCEPFAPQTLPWDLMMVIRQKIHLLCLPELQLPWWTSWQYAHLQFLSQKIQLMLSRQLFSHFMLQSACGQIESLADVDKWSSTWLAWRCLITYINSCSWMRLGWWQSGCHSEEHTIICEGCIQLATHCKDLVRPEHWQEILQQSSCCCIGSSQQYA